MIGLTLLGWDVAVKVLSDAGLGTEGRARLLREAQTAAQLDHPFTDIEGSTPLWERDPERLREALARHDAILHEAALRQYAPLAEEAAVRYDHKLYQAVAHRAWAVAHRLAGEHAEAEARLNQALALFQGLDTRWQIGRTLFELGELARAQGETVAARTRAALDAAL